jgi:thiosulfate reductase cytochrome b subunit
MLGGLVFLAPLHAFGAWMFTAFLIMHVYLTTTGPTPLANVQAMVLGWEEMETVHDKAEAL